eukprot:gene6220-7453_t
MSSRRTPARCKERTVTPDDLAADASLPSDVVEEILKRIALRQRLKCRLVCSQWRWLIQGSTVWEVDLQQTSLRHLVLTIHMMGVLPPQGGSHAAAIIEFLQHEAESVRLAAVATLRGMPLPAVASHAPTLAVQLDDPAGCSGSRFAALEVLSTIDGAIVALYAPSLARCLRDPEEEVCAAAIRALEGLRAAAAPQTANIAGCLFHWEEFVRRAAVKALVQIGMHAAPDVADTVARGLAVLPGSLDEQLARHARIAMADVIGQLEAYGGACHVDVIAQMLEDANPLVCKAAVHTLGQLGEAAVEYSGMCQRLRDPYQKKWSVF